MKAALALAALVLYGCPTPVAPAGRFVSLQETRVRLYLGPSWEDGEKQPGEVYRFERAAGTLRPLIVSVVIIPASELKTIAEACDARERAFGKAAMREREAPFRVSGVPGVKRAIRLSLKDGAWATYLYAFTADARHFLIHGFAKPELAYESEADFDALVGAIQLLAR